MTRLPDIERATIAAWPAAIIEEHHGWVYLASSGITGRVNAVWPLALDGRDVDAAIVHAEDWFARRGLPCRFKIADGACAPVNLAAILQARGYEATTPTAIMAKALAHAPYTDATIALHTAMPAAFDAVIAATSASAAEADERRGIALRAPRPAAFAVFAGTSGADAIGMSVVTHGLAGIFLMRTKGDARRQGAARRILRTLLGWAGDHGASGAYLQVEADNAPALGLYQDEGFKTLTHYHFWRRAQQAH